MINIEELQLCLSVLRFNSIYIDGIQLYDQFLIHMAPLNKFTFSIKTKVENRNVGVELPSNDDVQCSFLGRGYQEVASYIHKEFFKWNGECHIYSLPYEFEYFVDHNNSFPGGIFHKVRQLEMNDKVPFERDLFKLISQDFPFVEFLCLSNDHSQKDKQHSLSTVITFPHLIFLDLQRSHIDYAELFLLKKNMHLPRLSNLSTEYKSLTTITNNFTIDATHFNFDKLTSPDVNKRFLRPDNFHKYFPLL